MSGEVSCCLRSSEFALETEGVLISCCSAILCFLFALAFSHFTSLRLRALSILDDQSEFSFKNRFLRLWSVQFSSISVVLPLDLSGFGKTLGSPDNN